MGATFLKQLTEASEYRGLEKLACSNADIKYEESSRLSFLVSCVNATWSLKFGSSMSLVEEECVTV